MNPTTNTEAGAVADVAAIAARVNDYQRGMLEKLAKGQKLGLADREDRFRQKLRKLGLIAYCGKPSRWQISALGIGVLRLKQGATAGVVGGMGDG